MLFVRVFTMMMMMMMIIIIIIVVCWLRFKYIPLDVPCNNKSLQVHIQFIAYEYSLSMLFICCVIFINTYVTVMARDPE